MLESEEGDGETPAAVPVPALLPWWEVTGGAGAERKWGFGVRVGVTEGLGVGEPGGVGAGEPGGVGAGEPGGVGEGATTGSCITLGSAMCAVRRAISRRTVAAVSLAVSCKMELTVATVMERPLLAIRAATDPWTAVRNGSSTMQHCPIGTPCALLHAASIRLNRYGTHFTSAVNRLRLPMSVTNPAVPVLAIFSR